MKRFFYSIIICLFFTVQAAWGETAESIFAKAYGHIYKNNSREAIRLFEKGIESYPDCAFLYAGMGDAYLQDGNYAKAINFYTMAQKKKYTIDNYKVDFYNASIKRDMQDVNNAVDSLIFATKISDNPTLLKNINYIMNEKYPATILMTEDYYNDEDYELKQINMIKASGKKDEALRGYLQILAANPSNYQAANNAGVTLIELRDYQLAEKYLSKALEINSASAVIYNNLGVVNMYRHNYKDMEADFANALKIKSDYVPALNNKVISKLHKNLDFYKYANINTLLDVIKKDNENYYAYRTLAKIYSFKGDYKSAYNIMLPVNSNYNFKLYTHKAYVSYKAGEYEIALQYIDKAISLYSDNYYDYELKGRILTALGRFDDASRNFQIAMQKNKKNSSVYYYNAINYDKSGDKASAMNSLKTFVSMKKGNSQSNRLDLLLNTILY